jgi:hypothetical protein
LFFILLGLQKVIGDVLTENIRKRDPKLIIIDELIKSLEKIEFRKLKNTNDKAEIEKKIRNIISYIENFKKVSFFIVYFLFF